MTTATGITHQTENFELRNRRLSSPSDQNPFDGKPTTEQLDAHRKSTAADPLPRGPSDISSFRSLIATNKSATDILLSLPESSSTTLFYVQNGSFKRNTPSVKLCYSTKEGPVIATLKLGWGRDNTFGLGDPAKGDPIDWENMRRVSDWTHSTYQFSYGSDSTQGGRKTFVWVRTKQGFWSDQPNMELREKSITGELGEVLGIYQGNQGLMWNSRGQFWLSPTLHTESGVGWEGSTAGSWSSLELVALISALGIIEASRRRARARRNHGVGGS